MAENEKEKRLQAKLGRMERLLAKRGAADQLDRERLMKVTTNLIETLTEPAFVEKMRQARLAAGEGAGLDTASRLLSIEGLREAGADIPPDFRLTSRHFEDRVEGTRIDLTSRFEPGEPVGFEACGGGGGLLWCGCGGFST
jgi:hypothetical protein